MKTYMLTVLFMLTVLVVPAAETTTVRDSSGKTTGTETANKKTDGATKTTYRDANGNTTGTASERKNADGSTTTTYRDAQGRTTGTKTSK